MFLRLGMVTVKSRLIQYTGQIHDDDDQHDDAQ